MIQPDQFKNSEAVSGEEENFERALRPKELVDYVGQEKIRLNVIPLNLILQHFVKKVKLVFKKVPEI